MKITEVKVHLLKKKLTSTMQISRGGFSERVHAIVEVKTDAGISGLGEGIGNALYVKAIIESLMGSKAVGENPLEIEKVKNKLLNDYVYYERKGSAVCAVSAIEMALFDIKGKHLGVPAYQLLGGKVHSNLEAYVSDIYWEDPTAMANCAKRIVDQGFKILKAHIGHGSPEEDLKRVEAIRKAVGDKIELMIDLNCGYSEADAAKAIELWQPYNLYWIEEPVHPDNTDGMSRLKAKSKIPIAAGENEFGLTGFKELFEKKSIDIAMPDVGRAGGMLETKQICELAQTYGVKASIHNFSSGVLLAATMQVMAATKHSSLLEFDSSTNAVYHDFFIQPLEMKNGIVTVQDLPGLGVHLTDDIKKKYLA